MTSLGREKIDARGLYEDLYCARGEMENRIKECQLDLFADRTSSATMQANQLRLWFASMAYVGKSLQYRRSVPWSVERPADQGIRAGRPAANSRARPAADWHRP